MSGALFLSDNPIIYYRFLQEYVHGHTDPNTKKPMYLYDTRAFLLIKSRSMKLPDSSYSYLNNLDLSTKSL